jgi:hypothetical protein
MKENDVGEDNSYLWDGSGEPDPDVVRLEALLAPLRHKGEPPELPRQVVSGRTMGPLGTAIVSRSVRVLAVAAAVVLIVSATWFAAMRRSGWAVQSVSGAPVIDGAAVTESGRLGIGEWLVTDGASRARIAVGRIGRVDVDPNTRVQLVESRGREHRMSLVRGTIHARIWAPPKFFFVNTPSATAIDLGCAYTLQVDDSGGGQVRVSHGWVEFESDGRQSFVPAGAMCATRQRVGPGTPHYEDAPSGYGEALTTLDFGRPDDPARRLALDLVLSRARPRDALTLWHLLSRGTPDERSQVCDRLTALAPPPAGVTCEAVLRGDRRALDAWWDSLGLGSSSWWWLLKKKW